MPIKTQDTKFSFNGHQTFPLRYGWIEKICLELVREFQDRDITLSALQPDILVASHGLGQNMAKSARYWLRATSVISENSQNKTAQFTDLGWSLFGPDGSDRYLEKMATIWRLHWRLTLNSRLAPSWFWYFNFFGRQSFDRQELIEDIAAINSSGEKVIKRDVDCLVRSYSSSSSLGNFSEDDIQSPLSDLSLFITGAGGVIRARRASRRDLPLNLLAASILRLWNSLNRSSRTISLEACHDHPFSPGRAFLMDRLSLENALEELEKETVGFSLDRSSGLSQIAISNEAKFLSFCESEHLPENLMGWIGK